MRLLTLLACLLLTTLAAAQAKIQLEPPTMLSQQGFVSVRCEPIFIEGKWTPHVKNCKLQEGATIDDAINGMTDLREMERKQWAGEREILITGLDKGIKAATLYKQAYEKCSSTSSHASIERHDY